MKAEIDRTCPFPNQFSTLFFLRKDSFVPSNRVAWIGCCSTYPFSIDEEEVKVEVEGPDKLREETDP